MKYKYIIQAYIADKDGATLDPKDTLMSHKFVEEKDNFLEVRSAANNMFSEFSTMMLLGGYEEGDAIPSDSKKFGVVVYKLDKDSEGNWKDCYDPEPVFTLSFDPKPNSKLYK